MLTVELSAGQGDRIYYTLDNTDPDEGDTLYTGPITITGTTILRTRIYSEGYLESYMDTQSYLYDVNNGDGSVYVVSLVSDPYNLTSDEAGIMVKGPNALPDPPYGSMTRAPTSGWTGNARDMSKYSMVTAAPCCHRSAASSCTVNTAEKRLNRPLK